LFLRFHDAMMLDLAKQGALELLILRARGEPVAAIHSTVWAGKVSTYQMGRRTDVPENLSPGCVIFALTIRRAIEQGRREFDMLADAVYYKQQLTPHTRPLVQVRATRKCAVEMMRKAGISFLTKIKRSRQAVPDVTSSHTST
jgi:CelD/BcsL family acetyltransferase involved in cellulose biosynthesis